MSTIGRQECVCAVCGHTDEYHVLMSTNTLGGSMDLDTRPPEMMRSTMSLWVQECPHCGYAAGEVCDKTAVTPEYLKSEDYVSCNGLNIRSDLAKRFYKHYMIKLREDKPAAAFNASLYAAWASEDENDVEMAKLCRRQCVELLSRINIDEGDYTLIVVKADLLRRLGCFEEVIAEYSDMQLEDELLQKIIEFQVNKSREKDAAAYRVADVEAVLS